MSDALCATDPVLHDADPGQRSWLPRQVAHAAAVCRVCPLLGPCKRYAADMDRKHVPIYGVVAGQYHPWPNGGRAIATPCHGCGRLVVSRYYTRRFPDLLEKYLTGTRGFCRTCWDRERAVAS